MGLDCKTLSLLESKEAKKIHITLSSDGAFFKHITRKNIYVKC